MRKMPVLPVSQVGDVVQMSSKLRMGRNYGDIFCYSYFNEWEGRNVLIESIHFGYNDNKVYYTAALPPLGEGGTTQRQMIAESMLKGARKKGFVHRITPEFVFDCYKQLGFPPITIQRFFNGDAIDPLAAIYLTLGGDERDNETVKRTLVRLYDGEYLRGFAVGVDDWGMGALPDTVSSWDGYRDGKAVRIYMQNYEQRRREAEALHQLSLGC